jgi:hypothetical protein
MRSETRVIISKRMSAYDDNPANTWNFYCAVELHLTTGRVPASRFADVPAD